jgi:hypothetical protein
MRVSQFVKQSVLLWMLFPWCQLWTLTVLGLSRPNQAIASFRFLSSTAQRITTGIGRVIVIVLNTSRYSQTFATSRRLCAWLKVIVLPQGTP